MHRISSCTKVGHFDLDDHFDPRYLDHRPLVHRPLMHRPSCTKPHAPTPHAPTLMHRPPYAPTHPHSLDHPYRSSVQSILQLPRSAHHPLRRRPTLEPLTPFHKATWRQHEIHRSCTIQVICAPFSSLACRVRHVSRLSRCQCEQPREHASCQPALVQCH